MSRKANEPFHVPSLAEADPDGYGVLVAKRAEQHDLGGEARKAVRSAERELDADNSREIRPGVAELLGDSGSTKADKRVALAAARQQAADVDAALLVIEQRIRDAKTAALRRAIAIVRPEFDRRMQALCDALKAADSAHREFDELCQSLEHEDISVGHLGPRPHFLGAAGDGRIAAFLKEAGHA